MDIQEAKEKFGDEKLNQYNNMVWEPDPKRIRGLVLSFAQDVDNVFMYNEDWDAEDYVDQFWSWGKETLGEGFDGVFFSAHLGDNDSFKRVTKDELVDYANKLYLVNDEYKHNIDSKAVVIPDRYQVAHDGLCWWSLFERWDPVERVEFFRDVEGEVNDNLPRGCDDYIKENYLYSTKRLALELIDSSISYSDIEVGHLCDEWIRIMANELGHAHGALFSDLEKEYIAVLPSEEDYRDWVLSEVEQSFEFRQTFNRFSERLSSEDTQRTLEPIEKPEIPSDDELEGQVSIDDFSGMGDKDE